MITLWYTKVKYSYSELPEVPARYYDDVLARLVAEGLYDEAGNKIEPVAE